MHRLVWSVCPFVLLALAPALACSGPAASNPHVEAGAFCANGCIEKDGTCYTGASDNAHCGGNWDPGVQCMDCGRYSSCLFFAGVDGPTCVSSSSGAGSGSSGSTPPVDSGGTNSCPVFSNQPTCPAASDASGCDLSLGPNCAADALPQGLSCSPPSQCQARIGPVDGCGRVDGWICSCVSGHWSCNDCAVGAALCEGGAGSYELPDGGVD